MNPGRPAISCEIRSHIREIFVHGQPFSTHMDLSCEKLDFKPHTNTYMHRLLIFYKKLEKLRDLSTRYIKAPWFCSSLPLPSTNTQIHTFLCTASSQHIQVLEKTTCLGRQFNKRIVLIQNNYPVIQFNNYDLHFGNQ